MKKFLLFICILFSANFAAAGNDFWNETYRITNLDVLNQRIENLKNENSRYDELNENYFYDCSAINDNNSYILRFTVWKKNEKFKNSEIVEELKIIIHSSLLKELSFRKNIKVLIELFGGPEGDDLTETLFDGYLN